VDVGAAALEAPALLAGTWTEFRNDDEEISGIVLGGPPAA